MKNSKLITISVEKTDTDKIEFLKSVGVNLSYECRNAIREIYKKKKIEHELRDLQNNQFDQ